MRRHPGSRTRRLPNNRSQGRAQRACVGSLLMVVIATAAWGFDDQAPPDLSDVFASRPPRDLLDNEWACLLYTSDAADE